MRQSLDEEKGEAAFDPNTPLVQNDRSRQHHRNSGSKLSSTIHWLVHLVCVLGTLFVFLKPHEDDSVVKCWNKFNSYSRDQECDQSLTTRLTYSRSFVGLREQTPLCLAAFERIKGLSKPVCRRGHGCFAPSMARCHGM